MLILFDIDMTLLETDHIGITLLEQAGCELFRPGFTAEGISFGGCLDPVIIAQMLINNDQEPSPENILSLRAHYHAGLERTANERSIAKALAGAHELVHATRAHDDIDAIGVLTGNYPETGSIKLRSAGFDTDHFVINAWGARFLTPPTSTSPGGATRRPTPSPTARTCRPSRSRTTATRNLAPSTPNMSSSSATPSTMSPAPSTTGAAPSPSRPGTPRDRNSSTLAHTSSSMT